MSKSCGYVYLLGDFSRENIYKIGVTTGTIENRIKKLQTGNSGEIYIVKYFKTKNPFYIEKNLHLRFKNKNVLNEWFELSPEDVRKFEEYCDNAEEIIISLKDNPFFKYKN